MSPKHKTATMPRRAQAKEKPAATKPNGLLTLLVIASIAVVVLGIIILKQQPRDAIALSSVQGANPAVASSPGAAAGPVRPSSPADQFNQALAGGQPVLVFLHSNNCQSCIDMMNVVDQVYPEFAGQIALVDVDVYDNANGPLMQRLGLRYIPTVVVFDKTGQSAQNIGAMKPDAFRTFLRQKALGG